MDPSTVAAIYDNISLPLLNIAVTTLFLLVALPATAVLGFLMGRARRRRLLADGQNLDPVVGETTLAAILALLSLLLAFTFGHALSLANSRETTLIEEASAIDTAFLRADYLEEPGRTMLQAAILDYAKTRLVSKDQKMNSPEKVRMMIHRSLVSQSKLWPTTLKVTADPVPPSMKIFIASATNGILDAHLKRMQTLSIPISIFAQTMMLCAALAGLFLLGDRSGMAGRSLTWRTFVHTAFLFVVMIVIVDTQRGEEGFIRLDDSALVATIYKMELALQN